MSNSTISLKSSIRTCNVSSGAGEKLQSDRYLNKDQLVCPKWHGFDTYGRPSHKDGFNATTAGCSDPTERIKMENNSRPNYMEHVSLNPDGIRGVCAYQKKRGSTCAQTESYVRSGDIGIQTSSHIRKECNACKPKCTEPYSRYRRY